MTLNLRDIYLLPLLGKNKQLCYAKIGDFFKMRIPDYSYSLETLKEIWNENTGCHIEIGPDRDGLDMIELRFYELNQEKPYNRVSFMKEEAILISQALNELFKEQNE